MKNYYTDEHLAELRAKFGTVSHKADNLLLVFARQQFKNDQAREFARHGFSRRLGTLRHCIQRIFRVIPPATTEVPSKSVLYDAQVFLQSFVANVYGCGRRSHPRSAIVQNLKTLALRALGPPPNRRQASFA